VAREVTAELEADGPAPPGRFGASDLGRELLAADKPDEAAAAAEKAIASGRVARREGGGRRAACRAREAAELGDAYETPLDQNWMRANG